MTMITADAPPAARPPRPTTVTVAFWLQLAAALLLFLMVGLTVAYAVYFDQLIDRAVELVPDVDPADVSSERTSNMVMAAVVGSVFLVGSLAFAATAWPLRRGSNAARIVTFIVSGLHFVACLLPCVGSMVIFPFFLTGPDIGYVDPEAMPYEEARFFEVLYEQTTSTEEAFFAGLSLGGLLEMILVIAIVILIVVPPAHRFFAPRTPSPNWPVGSYPTLMPGQPYSAYAAPMPGQPFSVYPASVPGQPFGVYPASVPGQPFGAYPASVPGQPFGAYPATVPGQPFGAYPATVPGQPSAAAAVDPTSVPASGADPASMPGEQSVVDPTSVPVQPSEPHPASVPAQPSGADLAFVPGQPVFGYPMPGQPFPGYPQPMPYVICPDPSAHVSPPPPATPEQPPPAGEGKLDA
ncbi:hypothetical protein [Asanoa iriomotensis]|uniref:Uncharacterized protein n=1 Tax=Asanoa iriomotensis TaxID=234613 RepID=A0ABQ4C3Z7_9ACTN|nr:hypothetical protein [Asanoa iriomotensis]GIF57516.1 hypothetical protein Air01nite_36110 [Asanoa iriomotensis]